LQTSRTSPGIRGAAPDGMKVRLHLDWAAANTTRPHPTTELQNRCAGESWQAGSISVRFRHLRKCDCPVRSDRPVSSACRQRLGVVCLTKQLCVGMDHGYALAADRPTLFTVFWSIDRVASEPARSSVVANRPVSSLLPVDAPRRHASRAGGTSVRLGAEDPSAASATARAEASTR
jgi:hypothetical protein